MDMAVPINNEEQEDKAIERDVIHLDIDNSNIGNGQFTNDENSTTSATSKDDTEKTFIKQQILKTNFAAAVTIISCVMACIKTFQTEFMGASQKYTKSHLACNKMRIKQVKPDMAKEVSFISKSKSWLQRFVNTLHFYPKTFLNTYLLEPEEYHKFVDQQKHSGSKKEAMQFEWCRLSSFASYPQTCHSVIRLAGAGFYYDGNGDEVTCYFCGLTHKDWKPMDDPKLIHKQKAPKCPFVIKNISETSKQDDMRTYSTYGGHASSGGACGNAADSENLSVVSEKHYPFVKEQHRNESRAHNENTFTVVTNRENSVAVDRNRENTESSMPRERAEYFSSQIKTNQTQTVYSRNNTTGLIHIPATNFAQQLTSTHAIENTARSSASNTAPMSIGICLEKPKYPKFAIKTTRLSSFDNWPLYLTQTPEELINAGFFYTGIEDHCRCFFCGGGLRRWEEGDLPWTEHARWYSKCPFVIQCKGEKFIEAVQQGENPEITTNVAEKEHKHTPSGLNGYTNNPAVQTILDFGYECAVVKTAFARLKESGIHDVTASLLLETICEKEESDNQHASSEQTIASHSTTQEKQADDTEHFIKTPDTIEQIDTTLELSIRSLEKENRNLKDQQTCKICLDEPVAIVFLPCGHMAACINCAPALRRCPICRAFIKGTVKAIMC